MSKRPKDDLEILEEAFGKKYMQLAEIDCEGMSVDGKIELCHERELSFDRLLIVRERIIARRNEVLYDMKVIADRLMEMNVDVERDVTPQTPLLGSACQLTLL